MAAKDEVSWGWASPQYLPQIWVKYRLTSDTFNRLWEAQEGKCATCKRPFAHPLQKALKIGLRCEIDHCHKTSKVRGLLCLKCNQFLGKVQDNRELLLALEGYLKRNGDW